MSYLSSLLEVMGLGLFILMIGIIIDNDAKQSLKSAFSDSLIWGIGGFLSFGTEFMLLGSI